MAGLLKLAGSSSRALSYFLGLLVLAMAVAVLVTAKPAGSIIETALSMFGISFTVLLALLVFVCVFAFVRLQDDAAEQAFWRQLGMHAANGIATLALTYTLLGISLGIGSLAEQSLTPETIQGVIGGLTRHFSMAFMTSVVGLPLAALARAALSLAATRTLARKSHSESQPAPTKAMPSPAHNSAVSMPIRDPFSDRIEA